MTDTYAAFLESKTLRAKERGLSRVPELAPHLFPFQRHVVEFNLRAGSAGCFLDTGLGKTEVQLEFCQRAIEATNKPALIWTPLAVAQQTKKRADRWGYEARVIREQSEAGPGINICNYDRRDKIDPSAFDIVSCDEASILKSFTGKTTRALIEAHKGARFKLVATATPAPNDHMELGNYAEFLEVMAANEMLSRFFINDTSTASQEWRLKGHAVQSFWDWLASWARMAEKPSDLTGNVEHDRDFVLPPFETIRHRAKDSRIDRELQDLFGAPTLSATNMFDIKRQTTIERVKVAADIIFKAVETWRVEINDPSTDASKNASGAGKNTPLIQNTGRGKKRLLGNVAVSNGAMTDCAPSLASRPKTIEQCYSNKMAPASFAAQETQAAEINISQSTTATRPERYADFSVPDVTWASDGLATIQNGSIAPPTISGVKKIPAWIVWCDTNDEQTELENQLGDLCISIRGSQDADEKEHLHDAWLQGARPVLVTKPSIFGFGCDWQHCANMIFVGRTFSYETFYQAVRRCWRFGQKKPVKVHLIVAEGEGEIGRVIDRKSHSHASMKHAMQDAMRRATGTGAVTKVAYQPKHQTRLAPWISAA